MKELKNEEIVMMLKPALDADGDHQLEYAIRTKPMNGLSNAEVRKYCQEVDAELEKLGANNAKQENVVYMTPELARKHNQFSIRTATIGFALRDAGIANWSW